MDDESEDWTEIGNVFTNSGALMMCDPTYLKENHLPSFRNKLMEISETCGLDMFSTPTPTAQKIRYPDGREGLGILLHPGCADQQCHFKVYVKCKERVPGCRWESFELKFVPL